MNNTFLLAFSPSLLRTNTELMWTSIVAFVIGESVVQELRIFQKNKKRVKNIRSWSNQWKQWQTFLYSLKKITKVDKENIHSNYHLKLTIVNTVYLVSIDLWFRDNKDIFPTIASLTEEIWEKKEKRFLSFPGSLTVRPRESSWQRIPVTLGQVRVHAALFSSPLIHWRDELAFDIMGSFKKNFSELSLLCCTNFKN